MRDIRTDLKERLEAIGRDREELKRRLAELEPLEAAIEAVLTRENENFAASQATPAERNIDNFSAVDAVGSYPGAGVGFGAQGHMVNFAPNDAVDGVKPGHWGEFKAL